MANETHKALNLIKSKRVRTITGLASKLKCDVAHARALLESELVIEISGNRCRYVGLSHLFVSHLPGASDN